MASTAELPFPLDEVEVRLQSITQMIPRFSRDLVDMQPGLHPGRHGDASTDYQLMTRAEERLELAFGEHIQKNFPDDSLHCEGRSFQTDNGEFQWWVDALDGTRNYIHQCPLFCLSIGLCFRDQPVAGVVAVPTLDEIYRAIYGQGATKNGHPIQVAPTTQLERALLASGLPYQRKEIMGELISNIAAFIGSGAGIRRTGSAVLDLCWVAEGRFDGLWERDLGPQDLCAAGVILEEAGGRLTGFQGEKFHIHTGDIIASNRFLHKDLLHTLQQANRLSGMN